VYKETTTKANKQLYITYKRKYKDIVKTAKANFIHNTVASSTNISKTLRNTINDKRCNEGKKDINNILLHYKDQKVMCPQRICNIINLTFLDNVDKLACNNHPTILTSDNITNNIRDSFYLPEVTEENLLRIIGSLKSKKSTGIDGISPFLLKRCASFIIKPLLEIINIVIRTGTFPECLKRSVVIPIPKNGVTTEANNYFPITLVPAMSKVLEKIIAMQLVSFINKHNIFSNYQFGFRKHKSTNDAIVSIIDDVIEYLDKKNCIAIVFSWTCQRPLTVLNINYFLTSYILMELGVSL
jgi:hypothetical protein